MAAQAYAGMLCNLRTGDCEGLGEYDSSHSKNAPVNCPQVHGNAPLKHLTYSIVHRAERTCHSPVMSLQAMRLRHGHNLQGSAQPCCDATTAYPLVSAHRKRKLGCVCARPF